MSLPLVIFAALAVTLPQGPPLGDAFLPEPVPAPQTAPDADAEPTAHDESALHPRMTSCHARTGAGGVLVGT